MSTMEFDVSVMMGSQWDYVDEYADYEPTNIHIYEKEFRDYVVYYVAQGDSRLFLSGLQQAWSTGTRQT